MSDETKEPEEKHCVFCGEVIEGRANVMVQVLFDGWKQVDKGKLVKKKPGAVIYWHNVCGMPEDDDAS